MPEELPGGGKLNFRIDRRISSLWIALKQENKDVTDTQTTPLTNLRLQRTACDSDTGSNQSRLIVRLTGTN